MPRLGVSVDFLSQYVKLGAPVRKRTDEAITKFQAHTHAGLHLEKLNNARDDRVRTIRITQFWRGVVVAPESGDLYMLMRVMPHDMAIDWARKHVFTVNEVSGVLEFRDIAELERLTEVQTGAPLAKKLFTEVSDGVFRRFGVDDQVLAVARTLTDEASFDAVMPFLPEGQGEVLYALATGMSPEQVWSDVVAPRVPAEVIDTNDLTAAAERSQGRIALVDGPEELLALFDKPLALWRVFLHPAQEKIAYRPSYWGSAQVTGGPGTGKTVVALHRVKHLITSRELPTRSILLTTFTRGLADALERDLAQLLEPSQRRAVQVINVDRWANGVIGQGKLNIVGPAEMAERCRRAASQVGAPFSPAFLRDEWEQVVLANDVSDLDGYLAARRRGRGRRLGKAQKRLTWAAIEQLTKQLRADRKWTHLMIADEAVRLVAARRTPPFRHVVVDEIQDLHPAQWRLLRAAAPPGPDDLFLTGDPHQRIYGNHVSLRQVGISVTGRSTKLRINYRTTAEILGWSLGVLDDSAVEDLDDGTDSLEGYRSALHGEPPSLAPAATLHDEARQLISALRGWHAEGVAWHDMAVVGRTKNIARRATSELDQVGIPTAELHETAAAPEGAVRVGTMHGLKGLEFRCVAIAGAGLEHLPLPAAITPESEDPVRHGLELQQERCLLFVACTRARERLRVSWTGEPSRFIPTTPKLS